MMDCQSNFIVIADPHYYSRKLGDKGRAYELRNESDQKVLAQSEAVIRAAFDKMAKSDAEFILIAGDVSNDGERVSHEEFRAILNEYAVKKPIYLITSTHDWCSDHNPRRYDGENVYHDVECIGIDELFSFYADFGPNQSTSHYTTEKGNTSYALRPGGGLTLLCLNDDYAGENGSGYSEEHLNWIKEQVDAAKARNDAVVAVQHHHLMLTEFDKAIGGTGNVRRKNEQAENLADAGVSVLFVGHSHMQHITKMTSAAGNTLYEINVGSICGYPAPMLYCRANGDKLTVKSDFLESFVFDGKEYSADFLRDHATNLITKVIKSAVNNEVDEFAALLDAVSVKREDAIKKYRYAAPMLRKLNKATVRKTARLLNAFTFGKAIDKKAAKEIGDTRVLDIILHVLLNILDGGIEVCEKDSAYFKVVNGAMSLPIRAVKALHIKNGGLIRTLTHISNAAEPILCGGEINANDAVIPLNN